MPAERQTKPRLHTQDMRVYRYQTTDERAQKKKTISNISLTSVIPLPERQKWEQHVEGLDDYYYMIAAPNTSSLPPQDFHTRLTHDSHDSEVLTLYTKKLIRLSYYRDPEVASRILARMDLELEILAKLPQSDDIPVYDFVDPNRTCDRVSLTKWLRRHNPLGLHAIHLNTLSILRSSIDDQFVLDIPEYLELFVDSRGLPLVGDIEGAQRQQDYRRKLVEREEHRLLLLELFGTEL